MLRIIDWNIAFRKEPWRELVAMGADVALLQETGTPPSEIEDLVEVNPYRLWLSEHYPLHSYRPARVVKLSDRVDVEWFEQVAPHWHRPEPHQMPVSAPGLIDAATITPKDGTEPFLVVSLYGGWQGPHPNTHSNAGYPDASVHRALSDLTAFVPNFQADEPRHRIIAAGDLNVCFGDLGIFSARAQTIVDRMSTLGLAYIGPKYPNGRKADPVPAILAEGSLDVPTYYSTAMTPETAQLQLDHVFVSRGLHNSLTVRALNEVDEWGSSDHCRIIIIDVVDEASAG